MTVYATPVTAADFDTLIDGIVWSTDPNDHTANAEDLLDRIRAINLGWQGLQPVILVVAQDDPPTLNDWQTAWKDSGRTLPISGNVRGMYVSASSVNRSAAEYIFDNGDMVPMQARWWQGSVEATLNLTNLLGSASMGTSDSLQFSLPIKMRKGGWTSFVMLMAAASTTLPLLRWRTSREASGYTYAILPATAASNNVEVYHGTTRDSSPLVGTLDIYARKEAGSDAAITGYVQVNLSIDTIPGYMRHVYD